MTILPNLGVLERRQPAEASLRSRRSADFITAISAQPECRGIQRLPASVRDDNRPVSLHCWPAVLTQPLSRDCPGAPVGPHVDTREVRRACLASVDEVCDQDRGHSRSSRSSRCRPPRRRASGSAGRGCADPFRQGFYGPKAGVVGTDRASAGWCRALAEPSTWPTLRRSASGVKGFWRKTVPGSSTPCCTTAWSV